MGANNRPRNGASEAGMASPGVRVVQGSGPVEVPSYPRIGPLSLG